MQAYPEVPQWWYVLVAIPCVALLFAAIEAFPTELPIWGAVVGLAISLFLAVPAAMLRAITNQHIAINVFSEMMAGYMFPGRPIANMIFKSIAVLGVNQPVTFAGDLKLGHYMKVPPRMMFMVQLVAVIISCVLCLGIQQWMFANIVDFCSPTQSNGFICAGSRFFATEGFIYGAIGPSRLFGPGRLYVYVHHS
jgi:OPT family oligopeptide transporter